MARSITVVAYAKYADYLEGDISRSNGSDMVVGSVNVGRIFTIQDDLRQKGKGKFFRYIDEWQVDYGICGLARALLHFGVVPCGTLARKPTDFTTDEKGDLISLMDEPGEISSRHQERILLALGMTLGEFEVFRYTNLNRSNVMRSSQDL